MKKLSAFLFAAVLVTTGCSRIYKESYVTTQSIYDIPTETVTETASLSSETNETTTLPLVDFTQTQTVNSSEEFFALLTEARDRLIPTFELKINEYTDEKYNIQDFEKGKYSLSSQGKQWGKTAYMTYTFDYSDSYMISRAIEVPALEERLSESQRSTAAKLKQISSELITPEMSAYQKELVIHDYIVKNFRYDTNAAAQAEIPDSATSITAFLANKTGVCEAYAYTFKALCNLSGLECYVVTGKMDGMGHAWNIVKLDGSFYHVDTTSDDPIPDIPDHCFHTYFNITDTEASKTHILENKWYECTDTKYNYFIYNGLLVDDSASFIGHVENAVSSGATTIVFKAQNYYVNEDDISLALRNKGFTSYTLMGNTDDPNGDFELTLSR